MWPGLVIDGVARHVDGRGVHLEGGAPCCCGQVGNGCNCESVDLVGCQAIPSPGPCCNWGTERRQTLAVTFRVVYDKPATTNFPFTCQATLEGRIDAVLTVTCRDNNATEVLDVSDFSISGSVTTSSGRAVNRTVTRGNYPIQWGTADGFIRAMFLRVGETCYTGATNRLLSIVAQARAFIIEAVEPTGDFYAVPDPAGLGYFHTNESACNPAFEGSRCDCPGSFQYVRVGGLPLQVSFGVFGWTENPAYNWTGSPCDCRRTLYSVGNQYDLQDNGIQNFAGRISINGAYTHAVTDVVECVPNPCESGRGGCANCGDGGGL